MNIDNFKSFLLEDSEDVTTRKDICDMIDSLDDYSSENVDYDEIMEILLDYISQKYDVEELDDTEELDDVDESEDINEKRRDFFDKDLGAMRRDKKSKKNKMQLARQAKLYYKKNKNKLKKKQKKYRKKVKSGKIIPRQHSRVIK
jgi:hypothetical protein